MNAVACLYILCSVECLLVRSTLCVCGAFRPSSQVTGLAANSVHHFRVCAVNLRGVASEWSLPAQAATSLRRAAGSGGGGEGRGWDDRVGSLLCKPQHAAEVRSLVLISFHPRIERLPVSAVVGCTEEIRAEVAAVNSAVKFWLHPCASATDSGAFGSAVLQLSIEE